MTQPRLTPNDIQQDDIQVTTASGTHDKRLSPHASGTRRAVRFGTYRLFARLGSGGMAEVYLAVSQSAMNVNRLVVIKRLREEQANDEQARDMFLTEARIAARLNHPNVIQTFEAGCEGDSFFIAMEYVDGQPLSRLLTAMKGQDAPLDARMAARILADALNGMHYAHELTDFDGTSLELVHRDVSPQNIMVSYDGATKLVDFGIAKAVGTTQTEHGVFKGKVAFMAPEQVKGDQIDRRADIFAAGIVLWEAVTGTRLMADRDPAATLYNLLTKQIPRASDVNPRVPEALDTILERALQRDPNARYQTAKEMRDDLEAFLLSVGGVSLEEIGSLMKELFAHQREGVQTQIRTQLASLSIRSASDSGRHPTVDLSRTQIRQMANALAPLDDGFTTSPSGNSVLQVATGPHVQQAPPSRRFAVSALLAVSALALAASGVALFRSNPAPAPVVATPAPTAVPAPVVTAAPALPATTSETASVPVTVAPRPTPVAPPPPRVVWTPPPRATPQAPPAASPDRTASAAPSVSAAPAKPQESAQGRTFRRDL